MFSASLMKFAPLTSETPEKVPHP